MRGACSPCRAKSSPLRQARSHNPSNSSSALASRLYRLTVRLFSLPAIRAGTRANLREAMRCQDFDFASSVRLCMLCKARSHSPSNSSSALASRLYRLTVRLFSLPAISAGTRANLHRHCVHQALQVCGPEHIRATLKLLSEGLKLQQRLGQPVVQPDCAPVLACHRRWHTRKPRRAHSLSG